MKGAFLLVLAIVSGCSTTRLPANYYQAQRACAQYDELIRTEYELYGGYGFHFEGTDVPIDNIVGLEASKRSCLLKHGIKQ